MKLTPITDTVSVAAQPSLVEIEALAAGGTRLFIDNRPDGEGAGQPTAAAEAEAAGRADVGYMHLPITGATIGRDDVALFREAIREAGGPVIAHRRGGTRSLTPWVLGEVFAGSLPRDAVIAFGAQRGFDLSAAARWLDANDGP